MRRLVTAAVVVCGAIGAAGCLAADTSHVLYLRPDGAVTWAVLERDVRSRDDDPLVRAREESEFVAAAAAARHPIGLGLTRLAPDRLSTRLLRRERPYTVLTEAGFERIDRLVERFFAELDVPAQATLLADAQGGTLTVSIDPSPAGDDREVETPVAALIEDLDRYRLVLTAGRFTRARGFELLEDGSQARLRVTERTDTTALTLALTWVAEIPPPE